MHTYERQAYEMAGGVAEMILDEKEQKRRYGAVPYPKGDSANGVLAEIAEAAEQLGEQI
jgi:hypothetical protein